MEWQETTAINPSAWSDQVENDLALGLCRQLGIELVEIIDNVPTAKAAREVLPNFMKACAEVRKALVKAKGPQIVTVKSDGTATVVEDTNVISDEERQAHEDRIEALRVYNSTEEQIKRGVLDPEEAVIIDQILNSIHKPADDDSPSVPIEIIRDKIDSAIKEFRSQRWTISNEQQISKEVN